MRSNDIFPKIFAGIDNIIFDNRLFDPSKEDILKICRFYSLGKLNHFEKEKGITVSHSNHLVFLRTTTGEFVLKFYPADAAKLITHEYAINRFLINRQFATPPMHAGDSGHPFLASNERLATCYSFIEGVPAWQQITKRNTINQIVAALLSLKNHMSSFRMPIPFPKQESFATRANAAALASRHASYDQKEVVEASLQEACRTFQVHQPLFKRQWLHNNSTLTNLLIKDNTVYTLDLSHIREDYILSDLAALVISCLFLNLPQTTIKTIVKNYFTQHKIKKDHAVALNALVKIGLINEYLKNVQRERTMGLSTFPADISRINLFQLKIRKNLILENLKKMSGANLIARMD